MPANITESDTFPAVLQTPVATTDLASAPGLLGLFLQPAANRLRWLFNRINVFVAGGTLTPSNDVAINTPTGKVAHVNLVSFASSGDGGVLYAGGTAGLEVPNGPSALAVVTGTSFTATGDFIGAASQVTGNALVGGTLGVTGQASAGSVQSSGSVTFIGAGRVIPRTHTQVGAAGMTASVSIASEYYYPTAASGSTVQIDDTGAVDGDTMVFISAETSNNTVVKDPGGSALISTLRNGGAGTSPRVYIKRIAGTWTYLPS